MDVGYVAYKKEGLARDICDVWKPDVFRDEMSKQVINRYIPAGKKHAYLYCYENLTPYLVVDVQTIRLARYSCN